MAPHRSVSGHRCVWLEWLCLSIPFEPPQGLAQGLQMGTVGGIGGNTPSEGRGSGSPGARSAQGNQTVPGARSAQGNPADPGSRSAMGNPTVPGGRQVEEARLQEGDPL